MQPVFFNLLDAARSGTQPLSEVGGNRAVASPNALTAELASVFRCAALKLSSKELQGSSWRGVYASWDEVEIEDVVWGELG
jgi:hypothetical protein